MTAEPLPAALEKAQRSFEAWRESRAPRERIPERLWDLAVKAAAKHGVYKTARALRLDCMRLKRRMPQASSTRSSEEAAPSFVELPRVGEPSLSSCVAWIESPKGSAMRLELRGLDAEQIASFARSFAGGEC